MAASPLLSAGSPVQLPPDYPLTLVVVVDTEEEFDWYGDFSRHDTNVTAIEHLCKFVKLASEAEIRPTYALDFPMASNPESARVLNDIQQSGKGDLGLQLHGWVTPPFEEEVNRRNSFQMNLAPDLERRKLEALSEVFTTAFGFQPRVHKAGRYGIGPQSFDVLRDLGILVDLSFAPAYDFTEEGGPDYSQISSELRWLDADRQVLEIPTSGAFIGTFAQWGPSLYAARNARNPLVHLGAHTLSRLRLTERIMLSPEGHRLDKLQRVAKHLVAGGVRVLTFSLHSSSLKPGGTAYVTSPKELEEFLETCRCFFRFFRDELGGRTRTALEVFDELRGNP